MKIVFFSAKPYDEQFFKLSNTKFNHQLRFIETSLSSETTNLIKDESVVCVFVNDILDKDVLVKLKTAGIQLIAFRCAGFNNIDIKTANKLGIKVIRVPAYSPNAIAELTVGLMISLNRKIHQAYYRVRNGDFSLNGQLGFDFSGRTAGVIGTGKIGSIVAQILKAFGMTVLAYDPVINPNCKKLGVLYVDKDELLTRSDIITLHCPLTSETNHLINEVALSKMKDGVMLINTSRGAVLDTCAIIKALKSKKIGYLGLDVYEQESNLFFKDMSCEIIQDDTFQRLITFPNVLITAHQGFFTSDALTNIATTTLNGVEEFEHNKKLTNEISEK
ncbi:MAG: 2-hydroxyacid dehydrogenase [Gammaproteobacteria bacterium]|nr:2-hydroxyacid dehydrogenase [Gammaproteobacteria bacterium]